MFRTVVSFYPFDRMGMRLDSSNAKDNAYDIFKLVLRQGYFPSFVDPIFFHIKPQPSPLFFEAFRQLAILVSCLKSCEYEY